jgi:hypothetical protein
MLISPISRFMAELPTHSPRQSREEGIGNPTFSPCAVKLSQAARPPNSCRQRRPLKTSSRMVRRTDARRSSDVGFVFVFVSVAAGPGCRHPVRRAAALPGAGPGTAGAVAILGGPPLPLPWHRPLRLRPPADPERPGAGRRRDAHGRHCRCTGRCRCAGLRAEPGCVRLFRGVGLG